MTCTLSQNFERLPAVSRLNYCLLILACFASSACTILPHIEEKSVTTALPAPRIGLIASTSRRIESHLSGEQSAFLLLEEAREGLDWRLALIDSATSSLDIQLYLWHSGASSTLMFDRAIQAADRGVRVRILVDDFLLRSNERDLATLCRKHPNFDVRIFNPGRVRNSTVGGIAEMLSNFKELNRRMHNKTFTADRSLSIVGGRNIGDHYFGMDKKYNFIDLDVLTAGPVVADISDGFDDFWNSSLSFPGEHLSRRGSFNDHTKFMGKVRAVLETERPGRLKNYPLKTQNWSQMMKRLPRGMHYGEAIFIQDHPEADDDNRQLIRTLEELRNRRQGEVLIVSPYLIPSDASIENLKGTIQSGVAVKILTASLEANNQALVDGHYRKLRAPMIDNGTSLFEFRPNPSPTIRADADVSVRSKRVALHAKTIVADRKWSFIGSLNLDPRAIEINTESGLLIESKSLARELGNWIDDLCDTPNSWTVTRNPDGKIQWESDQETRTSAPPAKWSRRFMSGVSSLLPIRDQL